MDGKGRWMDNVMIERIWRTLKYSFVYLHAFDAKSGVDWTGNPVLIGHRFRN
jgi:putative transposase